MSNEEEDKKPESLDSVTTPIKPRKKKSRTYEPNPMPQHVNYKRSQQDKKFGDFRLAVPAYAHGKFKGVYTRPEHIPLDDPRFIPSEPDPIPAQTDERVAGIDFPSCKANWNIVDRKRWMLAVEQMMQLGILRVSEMAKISGLSNILVSGLLKEVQEAWSKTVTKAEVNIRREALFKEADIIKEKCWVQLEKLEEIAKTKDNIPLHNSIIAYHRMILEAGKRQAMLCGLDKIEIQVDTSVTVEQKDEGKMLEELQSKISIPLDQLENLAKELAKNSKPKQIRNRS
jgi:hypothetical protein